MVLVLLIAIMSLFHWFAKGDIFLGGDSDDFNPPEYGDEVDYVDGEGVDTL